MKAYMWWVVGPNNPPLRADGRDLCCIYRALPSLGLPNSAHLVHILMRQGRGSEATEAVFCLQAKKSLHSRQVVLDLFCAITWVVLNGWMKAYIQSFVEYLNEGIHVVGGGT